jgi:hypothetical protein
VNLFAVTADAFTKLVGRWGLATGNVAVTESGRRTSPCLFVAPHGRLPDPRVGGRHDSKLPMWWRRSSRSARIHANSPLGVSGPSGAAAGLRAQCAEAQPFRTTEMWTCARDAGLIVLVRPSLLNCQAQTVHCPGTLKAGINLLTL